MHTLDGYDIMAFKQNLWRKMYGIFTTSTTLLRCIDDPDGPWPPSMGRTAFVHLPCSLDQTYNYTVYSTI